MASIAASAVLTAKEDALDSEEPPGRHRRAARAYRLRFDRVAGGLAWANAALWALLLIDRLFPASAIFPIQTGLQKVGASLGSPLVIGLLALLLLADAALGLALIRGVRGVRWAALLRALLGVGLALAYYAATQDFVSGLFFSAIQGFILALLTRNSGAVLIYPSMLWLVVFFVFPLFSVLAYSLGQNTALGTVDLSNPSLDNYARILEPVGRSGLIYVNIVLRTVWIAFLTTIICLLIGYPFAYWMAQQPAGMRNVLMILVMIPFWTNILVRTYAWLIILRKDGVVNNLLVDVFKVIDRPLELTNTPGALLLGLVYGYLPYMILPLYTAIERLDRRMVEAANDLYANPWRTFRRVVLPLTMPGIIAGSILVFIPSVGTYVVTNLLGGGKFFLIGNLLEQQFMGSSGNKAFGAAFGVVLTVLMLIGTMVYFRLGRKEAY